MTKDTFWELIHKAKEKCGQDMDAMANELKDWLVERGGGAGSSLPRHPAHI